MVNNNPLPVYTFLMMSSNRVEAGVSAEWLKLKWHFIPPNLK